MTPADPTFAAIVADALHADIGCNVLCRPLPAGHASPYTERGAEMAAAILDDPRFADLLARALVKVAVELDEWPLEEGERVAAVSFTSAPDELADAIVAASKETP